MGEWKRRGREGVEMKGTGACGPQPQLLDPPVRASAFVVKRVKNYPFTWFDNPCKMGVSDGSHSVRI